MASLNKCFAAGNLARDPELKYTPQGKAVVHFSVAVNEVFGEKKSVQFFNVVAWEKTAEACAQYLRKGSAVLIEGRMSIRSYEKDGQKRQAFEIVAGNVQFFGKPASQGQNEPAPESRSQGNTQAEPEQASFSGVDDVPF